MVANRAIFTFRSMQTKGFFLIEGLSIKGFRAFFDNIRSLTFSYTPYKRAPLRSGRASQKLKFPQPLQH